MHNLKSHSAGLSMIVGTLMAITIIAFQSLQYQKTGKSAHLQQQAQAPAQLVSEVPANELSFLASIALPVFLLAPLFYFLMRRQLQPLQKTQREIAEHLHSGAVQNVELSASGSRATVLQTRGASDPNRDYRVNKTKNSRPIIVSLVREAAARSG